VNATLPFIVSLICLAAPAVADKTFYVAPNGNDANAGSRAEPFATLDRARTARCFLSFASRMPVDRDLGQVTVGEVERR
jgi:hypothetical protein